MLTLQIFKDFEHIIRQTSKDFQVQAAFPRDSVLFTQGLWLPSGRVLEDAGPPD